MKLAGWIDRVDATCNVGTAFVMMGTLPLWPSRSYVVETVGVVADREPTMVPLPAMSARSVFAAYARYYGTLLAVMLVVTLFYEQSLWMIAVPALLASFVLTLIDARRLGSALGVIGTAALVGAHDVGPVTLALGIAGGIAAAVSMRWRRASRPRAVELAAMLGIDADELDAV